MSNAELIYRGEDKTIIITVKDSNVVVIDLDTASEIIVRLLDENENSIEQYNKAGSGDFEALDIPVPATGVMNLFLNAIKTDVAAIGFLSAEIKMRFEDVDFDDDTFDAVTTIDNIARIVASQTKDDI